MANHSLVIQIGANVQGLVNGLHTATTATTNWANSTLDAVERNEAAINGMSNKLGLLGAAMTGAALVAVKKFADFDQAMSNVAATGADAKLSIDELRQAALDAGQRTVYSATEAAGAIEELSKAGLSASDILGGALDGSLDLAAAGALSVADAASYTAIAMAQFNLEGGKASHVADLLAAGAGKALGDVSDLGMALKQGGLVASQTGLSIEETTAALAAFAKEGLQGSDAGTSLKTMLQRLTPQSDEAAAKFKELGISAYDANGNFVGLSEFAGQLQEKMRDLTPEARNAALAVMFGSDAVRGAGILFKNGAEGIKAWEMAVNDQGYAAEVAATRLDNLKGDLEQLSGAFDTALINMGEGANGPLRALVQSATDVVNALSGMSDTAQTATLAIVGVGGLAALGVAGMGKMLIAVKDVRNAMVAMNITWKQAALGASLLGGAIAAATIVMVNWASAQADARARTEEYLGTLDEFGNKTAATMSTINDKLSSKTGGFLEDLFGNDDSLITKADKYGLAVEDLQGYILGEADAVERVTDAITDYNAAHDILDQDNNVATQNDFTDALDEQANSLSDAQKKAIQKAEADKEAGITAGEAAAATDENASAVSKYSDALASGGTTTQSYTDALKELITQQRDAAGIVLSERDAQRQYAQAIDDATKALKENGKTLSTHTQKGRENQAALDDIAKSGLDVVEAMRANGASQKELQKAVKATRADFIEQAQKMGMSKTAAKKLADELGLIPKKVDVKVAVDTDRATEALNRWITLANGRHVKITVDQVGGKQYQFAPGASVARASGGWVSGEGTGTSDSIPALLSNGEYVIKASSAAKYGPRFLDLVNAGALNVPRFAGGGLVKGHSLAYWEERRASSLEVVQMRQRVRDLEVSLREQEKYGKGNKLKRPVLRGLDRKEAQLELRDAQRELKDALTANAINRSKAGTIKSRIAKAEKAKQAAEDKADAKRQAVDDAASQVSSLASGLAGGFSLADQFGQKDAFGYDKPVTGKSLLAAAQGYVNKLKTFASKMAQAGQKLGPNSGVILQEIVGLGVEQGTVALDAILSMSAKDSGALVKAYGAIGAYSGAAAVGTIPGAQMSKSLTMGLGGVDYSALGAAVVTAMSAGKFALVVDKRQVGYMYLTGQKAAKDLG